MNNNPASGGLLMCLFSFVLCGIGVGLCFLLEKEINREGSIFHKYLTHSTHYSGRSGSFTVRSEFSHSSFARLVCWFYGISYMLAVLLAFCGILGAIILIVTILGLITSQ